MRKYKEVPLMLGGRTMESRYGWNPIRWILNRPKWLFEKEVPAYKLTKTDQKQNV